MSPDLQGPKYIEVPADKFRRTTRDIDFDVFLKLSDENFAHVFSRTTGLDYKRLAQYILRGVSSLYILEVDRANYERFVAKSAQDIFLDPDTPSEKKVATLLNMTEQNMSEIFVQFDVDEKTANATKQIMSNYVRLMSESPKTLTMILRLVSHGEYLYYHAIASAIFSLFIAKASGQFNEKSLQIVGLGGFLHDIGMTQLPRAICDSVNPLNEEEWKEMKSHPGLGLRMLEGAHSISDGVRYIVYQHHEQPSGQGYPNGLRDNAIYLPAKVISLADSFSALISKRPFREAFSVEDAIGVLERETGKFDPNLVGILKTIFLTKYNKKAA